MIHCTTHPSPKHAHAPLAQPLATALPQVFALKRWDFMGLLLGGMFMAFGFAGGESQARLNAQGNINLQINIDQDGSQISIDTVISLDGSEGEGGEQLERILDQLEGLDVITDLNLDGISEGEDVEIIINRSPSQGSESFLLELNELVPDLSDLMQDIQELQERVRVYTAEADGSDSRAFLGVYFDAEQMEDRTAVRVTGVIPETGAEAAGVQEEDLLLGIDGRLFDGSYGIREALSSHAPGDVVTLQLEREGRQMDLPATLGTPVEKQELHWLGDDGRFEFKWDGDVDLDDMELFLDKQASKAGINKPFLGVYLDEEVDQGVRISGTVSGTTAEAIGLEEGDVVTAINGLSTPSIGDLKEAISTLVVGSPLRVDYRRGNNEQVAEGTMLAKYEGAESLMFNEGLRDALHEMEQMIEEEVVLEGERLSEDLLRDLERLREMEDVNILFGEDHLDNDHTRVVRRVAVYITMDVPNQSDMDQLRANANPPMVESTDLELDMVRFQPNPSNGQFELNFDLRDDGPVLVRLFDGTGRQVFDLNFEANAGPQNVKVDALGEPKGVYFLVIEQGQQAYTRKVVIQ